MLSRFLEPMNASEMSTGETKKVSGEGEEVSTKPGFRCVLCDKVVQTKLDLQNHFRQHANNKEEAKGIKKKPKPKIVTASTNSNTALAKKIKCDVCDQLFSSVTLAINHKYKQHPNSQSNHHCGFCGKIFPLGECLDVHIRTEHPKETKSAQQYKCKECSAIFYNVPAVQFHVDNTHKRITNLLSPIATLPPSKKISKLNGGEPCSVYYCHLCGFEYVVKFNLQKHLEGSHSQQERDKPPEQLIKCSLCDALFYNKRSYDNHNLHHTPDDLYIRNEQDRRKAVKRVDCDFDMTRVPTIWDKMNGGGARGPRIKKIEPSPTSLAADILSPASSHGSSSLISSPSGSTVGSESSRPGTTAPPPPPPSQPAEGRNRALVDSDSEARSDTSDESGESETEEPKPNSSRTKLKSSAPLPSRANKRDKTQLNKRKKQKTS